MNKATIIAGSLQATFHFVKKRAKVLFARWTTWVLITLDVLPIAYIFGFTKIEETAKNFLILVSCILLFMSIWTLARTDFRTAEQAEQTFYGHTFKVNSISFAHNGEQFVSTSDRVAIVWDSDNDLEETTRLVSDTWLGGAIFIPDSYFVVGVGGHGSYFLWDRRTTKLMLKGSAHQSDSVAIALDRDRLLMATADKLGSVKIWKISRPQLAKGSHKRLLTRDKETIVSNVEIRKIAFSTLTTDLACGDVAGNVFLFNFRTNKIELAYQQPQGRQIRNIAFSPNGRLLAIADALGGISILDASKRQLLSSVIAHKGMCMCCAFDNSGNFLATGGQDKSVQIWRLIRNTPTKFITLNEHEAPITSLAFHPVTNNLYSASRDTTIKAWKVGEIL